MIKLSTEMLYVNDCHVAFWRKISRHFYWSNWNHWAHARTKLAGQKVVAQWKFFLYLFTFLLLVQNRVAQKYSRLLCCIFGIAPGPKLLALFYSGPKCFDLAQSTSGSVQNKISFMAKNDILSQIYMLEFRTYNGSYQQMLKS